jgi:predicted O-linked N-acetylglucosamine transferase (SPINDLY family)
MTILQAFELALQSHQSGRLAEAEALYRRILGVQPNHAEVLHMLGLLAFQISHLDAAAELIGKAIALMPGNAACYSNLSEVLRLRGQLDAAITAGRTAIRLKPDYAEAQSNLGNALKDKGLPDEAIAAYRRAIVLKPDFADAHRNLGNALRDKGQLDDAITACRRAIAIQPNDPQAHNNLGNALKDAGMMDEAIPAYRRAIELKPDLAEAHSNLGNALKDAGRTGEAIAAYRWAIELKPDLAEAYVNLGNALKDAGLMDEAISTYRRAIELKPDLAKAHSNLGNALKDAGQLDEAIGCYRHAMTLAPDDPAAGSNLINALHFHPDYDAASICAESCRWNLRFAEPLRQFHCPHANDRDPERRLRIGYVSPDFRDHVVGRNILPILERHDRSRFEVFCYANVTQPDALTERFKNASTAWRNIAAMPDQAVADLIRADQIDILMDLALHMANHRLPVFARRPAPVQVTWAGYPGSTGLETIDYRISDSYLDPAGGADDCYSEATIRLPDSFWCHDPLDDSPPVNPLPALGRHYVTFGSLNNYCKVHRGVIELWSRVLCAVKDSRMLLLSPNGGHRQRALEVFQLHGVAAERIEWFTPADRKKYLTAYQRMDISLDTFPYNGHTTSLDSFWMGVPVVTLTGRTVVGRAGLSQLMNLGFLELIASAPDDYVRIASELANDLPRLSHLRSTLRGRMEQSPLMDAPRFARNMEAACREMWRHFCMEKKPALP